MTTNRPNLQDLQDSSYVPTQEELERYRGRDIEDMVNNPSPEPEPILGDGVLTRESQACVVGHAKVGKSIFTIGLGLCIAAGKDYLGLEVVKACRVFYLNFEIHLSLMEKRVTDIAERLDLPDSMPNFRQLTLLGDAIPQVNRLGGRDELIMAIRVQQEDNFPPEVVILDDRWRITQGDPCQEETIRPLCQNLEQAAAETGVTFIVVHHHGYNTSGVGAGSSAWDRWVNSSIDLMPHHWEGTEHGLRPSREIKVEVGGNYTAGKTLHIVREYPIFRLSDDQPWLQHRSRLEQARDMIIGKLLQAPERTIEQAVLRDDCLAEDVTSSTFNTAMGELRNERSIITRQDPSRRGRHNLVTLVMEEDPSVI